MQAAPVPELTDEDINHLKYLAIGHYVLGGLSVVCGLFPFIHLTVGIGIVSGEMGDGSEPQMVGWIFILIATFMIGLFWVTAGLSVYAGRSLRAQKNRTLCLVTAALACVFFQPIGLVLGIFTIIVLLRPAVKAAFEDDSSTPRAF